MTHAVFIDMNTSYYVGSLSSITNFTPNKSYTKKAAYLMSYALSEACLTHTYTLSTATTMTTLAITYSITSSVTGSNNGFNSVASTFPEATISGSN